MNPFFDNSMLRWIALALFAAVTVLFLIGHRTLRVYASVIVTLTILYAMAYLWGEQMNGTHSLFSPDRLCRRAVFLFARGVDCHKHLYYAAVLLHLSCQGKAHTTADEK